jgi:hypothetical protein
VTIEIVLGVILAAVAWGAMFVLPKNGFWTRAALAAATIGIYTVAVEPTTIGHLFDRRHWAADLGVGLAAGAVLYAVFWVGEQALVIVLPRLAAEVGDLYTVRGQTKPWFMPLVLSIAAPGEELFFRGLLQHQAGVAVALAVYGAVHLWERKLILVLAALIGGLWWGALLAWTGGLIAPLASHLLWVMMIVVWRPARPTSWAERAGVRVRAALGR